MLNIDNIEQEQLTEAESMEKLGWSIDNDELAEWALKKIKAAQEEHDRLEDLITLEMEKLNEKEKKINEQLERETSFLKYSLMNYMQTVKCKETKTQKSYQLLSGKLVHKLGGIEYKKDDDALLEWAKNNRPLLVKVKASVDWANLKKELTINGKEIITADGEVLECVKAEKKPDSFDIKW